MTTWTYEGYWNTVFGAGLTPGLVIGEFDLDTTNRADLSEWLDGAEWSAWRAGAIGGDLPGEWSAYHTRALDSLIGAGEEAQAGLVDRVR